MPSYVFLWILFCSSEFRACHVLNGCTTYYRCIVLHRFFIVRFDSWVLSLTIVVNFMFRVVFVPKQQLVHTWTTCVRFNSALSSARWWKLSSVWSGCHRLPSLYVSFTYLVKFWETVLILFFVFVHRFTSCIASNARSFLLQCTSWLSQSAYIQKVFYYSFSELAYCLNANINTVLSLRPDTMQVSKRVFRLMVFLQPLFRRHEKTGPTISRQPCSATS